MGTEIQTALIAFVATALGAAAVLLGEYLAERRQVRREEVAAVRLMIIELQETKEAAEKSLTAGRWETRFPVNRDKWRAHEGVLARVFMRDWKILVEARNKVFETRDRHVGLMTELESARGEARQRGWPPPETPPLSDGDREMLRSLSDALGEAVPVLEKRDRLWSGGASPKLPDGS